MTREEYKDWVIENCNLCTDLDLAIYAIDDLYIDGEYDYGYRGADHYEAKNDDVSWEQLIEWGTFIVPETEVVFGGDNKEQIANYFGYEVIDDENNHIIGY